MDRLSTDSRALADRYGLVIIGSGYGGAICAARLAEAGVSVCLLERGKEWPVGTFPDELSEVAGELCSEDNPTGLYEIKTGNDVDVMTGNGLGGTSLINANVVIEANTEVFQRPRWPRGIKEAAGQGELAVEGKYGRAVIDMLKATAEGPPHGWPLKVDALRKSETKTGGVWKPVPVAVNMSRFDNQPNDVGVIQSKCTQCGDCVTGCNVGAKNTLYMNYLPLAKSHGAEIFTRMEVEYVLPSPQGGYLVYVKDRGHEQPQRVVHARAVVVSAGALGSTGILMRSRERGLSLSKRLGHHFSTNGDLLGIGYNNDLRINSLGFGDHQDERAGFEVGPTILSTLDFRDRVNHEDRFIIEEGAVPRALVEALQTLGAAIGWLEGQDTDSGIGDKARELGRILRDRAGYDPKGASNHSMIYLGIGHDGSDGRIELDPEGKPVVLWSAAPDRPVFQEMSSVMHKSVEALGGTYIKNPRWSERLGNNLVTVHPLGGCPMADDSQSGVVNEFGQAFSTDEGTTLHDGLFVADGSVLPESVGVNPLYTISVLSERIAEHVAARAGEWAPLDSELEYPSVPAAPLGLEFTEEMKGFVSFDEECLAAESPEDYRAAEKRAREAKQLMSFKLTIIADDLQKFLDEDEHLARAEGYVESKRLGTKRRVETASFNLFLPGPDQRTRRMVYKLEFSGDDGHRYLLDGFKTIRDDSGNDLWSDNTTLYTTIYRLGESANQVVGKGIIYVQTLDFLKQLTTFRIRNSPSPGASAQCMGRFGRFFFGELWDTYIREQVSR